MENNVFYLLLKEIMERQGNIATGLASGAAESFEKYQRLVGEYSALSDMEAFVKELERRWVD